MDTVALGWHRRVLGASAFILMAIIGSDALAKKGAAEKPHAALIVVSEGAAAQQIVAAIVEFVLQANRFYPKHRVRVGRDVKKPFRQAVRKCGADAPCVAKQGKKQGLSEILIAKVEPWGSGGVGVEFLAVDVKSETITRSTELRVPSAEEVRVLMAGNYFSIVGITTPGYLVIPGAPSTIVIDGTTVNIATGKIELPPGLHTVGVQGREQQTMILPKETRRLTLKSFGLTNAEMSHTKRAEAEGQVREPDAQKTGTEDDGHTAAVASNSMPSAQKQVDRGSPTGISIVGWVGIGMGAAGVVTLGIGTYFATQTKAKASAKTNQVEAARRNKDAENAASRATTLFVIGGSTAAIGVALWAVDTFILHSESRLRISAAPFQDGAAVILGGCW